MTFPAESCTLSLCMIVKNEEKYLPECLESVRNVVDQIVIVDTGSTDGTVDIARGIGAEIYHYTWCDDFSSARNESIKYATGDWILWMDADERLVPDSISKLKKLLIPEERAVIYKIHINNMKEDGSVFSLSSAHRLFTNHTGIYFTGRIHEQVSPSAAKLQGEERDSNVYLNHFGYGFKGEKAERKNRRNRELLEKMVKETPNSAYAHYTLAQHFQLSGEYDLAFQHFNTAYNLKQFDPEMTASLLNTMSETLINLGRLKEAKNNTRQSIKMKPVQAGGYYLLYKIADEEGKSEETIGWLKTLLKMTRRLKNEEKTISSDILIDENKIVYTLGLMYQKQGKYDEALTNFMAVYDTDPNNIPLLERLVEVHMNIGKFHQAEKFLNHVVDLTDNPMRYLETLGTILIKQKKYHRAISIYESLLSNLPENQGVLRRLIGLYGKVGNMQKAQQLAVTLQESSEIL